MDKLPVYKALIADNEDGIYAVSLVDYPATEVDWMAFNKIDTAYSIQDEDKHILCGPVMLANHPIYRRDENGYEYNIVYEKETIRIMAEKMLNDMSHNNIDINHNGKILDKGVVNLVELYIVDKDKGINPTFIDVEDGSLMATYKVNDDELWEECKNGNLNGFSLAGYFTTEKVELKKDKNIYTIMKSLKEKLKALFMEFASIETDKAVLYWEGDGEIVEGIEVSLENGEPVEDGDYTVENKVITIKDSKVESIKETEEPATEEPTEEATQENGEETPAVEEEPVEDNSEITALQEEIANLKATMADLSAAVEEIKSKLAEPVTEPITEEFKKIIPVDEKFSRFSVLKNI